MCRASGGDRYAAAGDRVLASMDRHFRQKLCRGFMAIGTDVLCDNQTCCNGDEEHPRADLT